LYYRAAVLRAAAVLPEVLITQGPVKGFLLVPEQRLWSVFWEFVVKVLCK